MEPKEELKGGDYSNYIVKINEDVSYCVNIVDNKGIIKENDKIHSSHLIQILEGLATLMKINRDIHILMKGDEIIIGDINLEFYRKYIKIDLGKEHITVHYDFTY